MRRYSWHSAGSPGWLFPNTRTHARTHAHTHTNTQPFNGPFSGTTQVSRYQKGKPIWILLKQETVSGSGIRWAICKSAPRSRQITTPAPHHSVFLQAGCPSCRPTNSVKALKAQVVSRVVSVLDSGAEGPGFKSQSRRCWVTVLGKLFTPIVSLFTKQQNW